MMGVGYTAAPAKQEQFCKSNFARVEKKLGSVNTLSVNEKWTPTTSTCLDSTFGRCPSITSVEGPRLHAPPSPVRGQLSRSLQEPGCK